VGFYGYDWISARNIVDKKFTGEEKTQNIKAP
jgi:hypothetical protein